MESNVLAGFVQQATPPDSRTRVSENINTSDFSSAVSREPSASDYAKLNSGHRPNSGYRPSAGYAPQRPKLSCLHYKFAQ